MADKLQVDTKSLASLGTEMGSVRDKLGATGAALDSYSSSIGADDVLGALRDFEDHWGRGRRQIKESAEALSDMLKESAGAYEDVDLQASQAFDQQEETVTAAHGRSGSVAV